MSDASIVKGAARSREADTDSTADTDTEDVRKKFFGGFAVVIWCLALFWTLVAVIGFMEGSSTLLLVVNLFIAAAVAGFGILLFKRGRSAHGAHAVGAEEQLQDRLRDEELRSRNAAKNIAQSTQQGAQDDTRGSDSNAGDQ